MPGETVVDNPERPLSASEYVDYIVGGADYADAAGAMTLLCAGKAIDMNLLDNGQRAKAMADAPHRLIKALSENKDQWLPEWLEDSINRAYDGIEASRPSKELESGKAYSSIAIFANGASGNDMNGMIAKALSELEAKGSTVKYLDILVPSPAVKGSESIELPDPEGSRDTSEDLEEYIFAPRRQEREDEDYRHAVLGAAARRVTKQYAAMADPEFEPDEANAGTDLAPVDVTTLNPDGHDEEVGPYTAREAAIMAVLNYYDAGANPDFKARELYDAGNSLAIIDATFDPIEHGDSQIIPRIIESEAYDYRTTFITWGEYTGWFNEGGSVAAVTLEQDAISLDTVARDQMLGSNFHMPVLGVSEEGLPVRDKLLSLIASATPLRDLYEKVSMRSPSQSDVDIDAGRFDY